MGPDDNDTTTELHYIHVKGHADSKKKKEDITEHEHLNILTDKIAEQMYHRAKTLERKHGKGYGYERADATTTDTRAGDCHIRGHRIVGDNTKTIMTYISQCCTVMLRL